MKANSSLKKTTIKSLLIIAGTLCLFVFFYFDGSVLGWDGLHENRTDWKLYGSMALSFCFMLWLVDFLFKKFDRSK